MRLALFSALALLQTAAFSQTLVIVSGNGQVVQENFVVTKPLTARVVNSAGAGVADVPITWKVTQGEGALSAVSERTDANGNATCMFLGAFLPPPQSFRTSIVTATTTYGSVDFVETTSAVRTPSGQFAPAPLVELIAPQGDLNGRTGEVIPAGVGVRVTNQVGLDAGKGIPFVGVQIAPPDDPTAPFAKCAGPNNMVLTDQRGEGFCDVVIGTNPGTALTRVNVGDFVLTRFFALNVTPGPVCNFAVAPTSASFIGSGGSGTLAITAAQGCSWAASTAASWITIASGGSGQGSGTLTFIVAANTGAARTGTITVAGQTVSITQAAAGGGTGGISFISTSPLPAGRVGQTYSYQLQIAGGTAPFAWSATGTFPPGLGLNPTNGFVTGVPTTPGTFSFTLAVSDAAGASVTAPFQATISPQGGSGQLAIVTTSLPNGDVGSAYQQSVASTGACNSNPFGGGSVTWSMASGTLPPGLSGAPTGSDYRISGMPTAPGTSNFSLKVADTCGNSDTRAFTITITSTPAQTATLVATPGNISFSVAYTAPNGPDQPINLTSTNASLPITYTASTQTPWLSITNPTGTTPGTISVRAVNLGSFAPGNYQGSITLTSNGVNSPASIPVTLAVGSPSNITVSRDSLLFSHSPMVTVSQQTITVGGSVTGIPFVASATTDSGAGWLSVTPSSGETQSVVLVTVNTASLAQGTYTGTVRIAPSQNAAGAKLIPVTAVVAPPSALVVSTQPITFNSAGSLQLPVTSTTTTPVNFSAVASGASWLTVTPPTGTTPANLTVSASTTGLAAGTYQASITITPANSSQATVVPVTLTISTGMPAINAVTNAASFLAGAVAPGELVTIFGTNIGPRELTQAEYTASNSLQTNVAGTQVLFDNVAAPLIYSASGQVSAVVPFGVFGRTSTKVQVVFNNQSSNTADIPVADAAPGIFTLDVSGQGAILNQDNSINSRLNGAEPGSVIAIYATGGGVMDAQVVDGRPVTEAPYPRPLLPVGVRIGGRIADVLYAGAAPGLVAGMLQINARIPADTPRGMAVPIQITIGTSTSQSNVIVATRQ